MFIKKWLAVMLAMCVSAVIAPVCAQAEELADLPEPVKLETIVPSDTKIPEQLAYGAINKIDMNSIEVIEGSDFWDYKISDGYGCIVSKKSYVGNMSLINIPKCRLKIKNILTDFNDEKLDLVLELNYVKFTSELIAAHSNLSYILNPLIICPDNILMRSVLNPPTLNLGVQLLHASACIDFKITFLMAGTDDVYRSEYPAAWSYSDIDVVSSKLDCNESVKLGSGTYKTYISDKCELEISEGNRYFRVEDSASQTDGDDSYDLRGLVAIQDASGFEFTWMGEACGTRFLISANYHTGLELIKRSSAANFTKSCKGAVYGLYDDKKCTSLNRELTIGEDGSVKSGDTLDLDSRKYYLKELVAPEGYKLDTKVHEVDLSSSLGKWKEVMLTDEPLNYEGDTSATNGTISDSYVADYGSTKTIVYSPNEGYHLVKVVVDGEEVDIEKYPDSYTFTDIKADHEIHVVYEIDKFDLDTSVEGGTITEGGEADYGSDKTIEYSPNEGYHIVSVTVDDEEVDVEEHPDSYTFADIKADHKIHVVYEIDKFVIKTSVENGTITESSTVAWGENKLVEYAPKEGYHLESVVVDDEELAEDTSTDSHEFANVAADHEVKVVYAIDKKEAVVEEDDSDDAEDEDVAAVSTPSKTETSAAETQTTSAKKANLPSTGDGCVMLIVAAAIVAFCSFVTLLRKSV